MKRFVAFFTACLLLTACYEDYIFDYEYSAIYAAYQYDLRTFIPEEEDLQVSFSAALAGIIDNKEDRNVKVSIDNSLLSSDLSVFDESGGTASFTALDGLKGNGKLGDISQAYVSNEIKAAGISALAPLPESYYNVSPSGNLVIAKGSHTAKMRITPTSEMFKDEKLLKPYYAVAFRIESADADVVIPDKSFQIMAVKVENTFYGNWYHGGKIMVISNSDGSVISGESYPYSFARLLPSLEYFSSVITKLYFSAI